MKECWNCKLKVSLLWNWISNSLVYYEYKFEFPTLKKVVKTTKWIIGFEKSLLVWLKQQLSVKDNKLVKMVQPYLSIKTTNCSKGFE